MMTRIEENTLQEMLYKKTNSIIYYLQLWETMQIESDTCLQQIKKQYQDNIFIELFNKKNDENDKAKN
ncbi:MAG: hypothetical protein ACRCR9_02785 [Chitinophagaceae bacterium]